MSGTHQGPTVKKVPVFTSSASGRATAPAMGSKVTKSGAPSQTDSSTPKPAKHTPSPKSGRSPVASKTPSPQTADKQPLSHDTTSNDETVNVDNKAQNETEKAEIIPSKEKIEVDRCAICLDDCSEPKQLDKCGHTFCKDCIDHYFQTIKPQCPCCFTIYGDIRGNQPDNGHMSHTVLKQRLPGYGNDASGIIQIKYHFPNGIQDDRHPNPGMPYQGTSRDAYLPDNREGRHVLKLLERAFKLRQIFTIGQSRTTGCDNVVTWNDIHHKTSINGGMENFGYPDKTYLNRVQQELAAKGII